MAEPQRTSDRSQVSESIGEETPAVDAVGSLLRIARERYQKAVDHEQDNRDAGIEDLEFMAGDQWPEEIRRERNEDGRVILTINRMPAFVHQIVNDVRQNRPAIKVRPVDDDADDEIADIYTGLIRHIEHASDAMVAYTTATEGAAQCGIGHFKIVTEYSHDDAFDQEIRIRRIVDPYAVTWDPQSVMLDRSDALYCFYEEAMDIDTYKARYPDAQPTGFDFQDADSTHLGDWRHGEEIRVAEYWTKELQMRQIALLEDGRTIDITDMDEKDGSIEEADGRVTLIKRQRDAEGYRIEMRVINGHEILEGPFEWIGTSIPIIPVLGEETHIGRRTIRNGVIRHAKDPQRMYNYWRAAQTEYIALQPKTPWIVTPDNIAGAEPLWNNANRRNYPYLPYKPDKDNGGIPPQRNAPPIGSPAMTEEILLAQEDMKATTGIFDAGLGKTSNETSGKAILARQRESDVSTSHYGDNLQRAIVTAGRQLVRIIPKVYDNTRVVRLLNEDETTKSARINVRMIDDAGKEHRRNDLSVGLYDVVVTTGPSYTTKRAEAADALIALVQANPKSADLMMDIIARNLDFPGAEEIAERFRKTLPPGMVEQKDGEEPMPPPPPSPEQLEAQAKIETGTREQDRKDAESTAKIDKIEEEADAIRYDNMAKALDFMMANGEFAKLISDQIEQKLLEITQGGNLPPGNGAGPTPFNTPPPV